MPDELRKGRESYRHRAWADAYHSLSLADGATPLAAEDLELLASAAYLTGRELAFHNALDRAHHAHLDAGGRVRAARCAFWSGLTLLLRGDTAQATGWLGRAQRLVEGEDCVEHGYLLLPVAEQRLGEGDGAGAHVVAARAAGLGDRFRDADLIACARHVQGRALIQVGQVQAGLALLDEAMLAVVAGELAPIMTGLIYCSVIDACQELQALRPAREWTTALARWCEQQPQLVAFTSTCLVHRAEIMQLNGAWTEAMAEACRACERFSQGLERVPPAAAFYRRAELHRLRGELAAAEEAYRTASRLGRDPQPGLALLRLAQGRTDAASAAIRRVVGATPDPLQRAKLLPAQVEIMLAVGGVDEARSACRALEECAETFDTEVLRALAAQARGAVLLAEREAQAALGALRRAFELWQRVEAPYEAARVRALMGLACRSLGDHEAADLELGAARAVFEGLGASPELARLDAIRERSTPAGRSPLTPRELQVLRLVAAGRTNKAIAAELFLSERTIDRHISNIFRKLNVPSRAAATAHAYDRKLL
ncbi:response regulator receiver protein [Anaeromyxobacter sp. Fw109-5]|nr:response regulator receiver protein [Anaeromyxobacter sp. Fw109-5]